jgi:feruloyl esterase
MKFSVYSIIGLALAGSGLTATLAANASAESAKGVKGNRPSVALNCEALKNVAVAHTAITSVETVAAGTFRLTVPEFGPPPDFSKLPAFCRVTGSIHPSADSDIRFELWLPKQGWNGKFLQTGNGGAAGTIVHGSLAEPLSRGYAAANTDTGHQGGAGDFAWAVGHPEKMIDYAYRAVHELTVVGKAITETAYRKTPAKSYWFGCSTGGRQGLKEAQRYPEDYDAIIAGAPASNWSPLLSLSILIQHNLTGPSGLAVDKLAVLREAALGQCDAADGLKDRIISDPDKCAFDPATVQCQGENTQRCLSASEVAAAQRIYRGVVNKSGETLIPGTGPGSELEWAAFVSQQFRIGTNYFRNVVAHDPNWDPATFDVDVDVVRMEKLDAGAADAMDPDLSQFIARGGKLITYHGTTDGIIPFGNSVNYYRSLVAKLGEDNVSSSVRLYLVPGMGHCLGGEGAFVIDWLSALENWVEKGKVPGALTGTHPAVVPGAPGAPPSPSKSFTRPVCAYRLVAKYNGTGDTADAANFSCVAHRDDGS